MTKKRNYYAVDGVRVPGVTTIIGCLDKPALVPWAAKMCSEYIRGYWEQGKQYDQEYIDSVLLNGKSAHRRRKEDAGQIGTEIHALVESYCGGQLKPEEITDTYKQKALENFIKVTEGWVWLAAEIVVLNRELFYGGTADGLARLPSGMLVLTDTKTSSGVYPTHDLQCAFYCLARPQNEALVETWEKIEEARILHFDKELCTWEILERDVKCHYDYIPAIVKAYRWKQKFDRPVWEEAPPAVPIEQSGT